MNPLEANLSFPRRAWVGKGQDNAWDACCVVGANLHGVCGRAPQNRVLRCPQGGCLPPGALFGESRLGSAPQAVEVVEPRLHHLPALGEKGGPVVGPAVRVLHGVGQLVLDDIGPKAQDFVQDGPVPSLGSRARQWSRRQSPCVGTTR